MSYEFMEDKELYYAFPDIHGEYDLLRKALDFVENNNPSGSKIIFLGDYIDRGSKNKQVLETIMNPPENWEYITLMGNHEEIFINSYENRIGFYDPNVVYEFTGLGDYTTIHQKFPKEIIAWMKNLKLFHIEDKNVFAHAYYDDYFPPEMQSRRVCCWQRVDDWQEYSNKNQGLYLTHGHTPRKYGPVKAPNRVNLDCGAYKTKKYVIGIYRKGVQGLVDYQEFTL